MALNLKISNIRTISQYEFEKPDCFGKIDSYESISKKDFENIIDVEELEIDALAWEHELVWPMKECLKCLPKRNNAHRYSDRIYHKQSREAQMNCTHVKKWEDYIYVEKQ